MKLYNISLLSIRRRKSRTAFLIIGLLLAVSSFVTLYIVSENVNKSVAEHLDDFGANMIVTPKSDGLNFSYGGIAVPGLTVNNGSLNGSDIDKIKSIKNKDNLSIISPKLFNAAEVNGQNIIIAGVDFREEVRLKKWWKVSGNYPSATDELIIGSEAAKVLNAEINQKVNLNDKEFLISGVLNETGSQDDELIFLDLSTAQKLFNKQNNLSLIEIAARCYDCPIEEIVQQASRKLPGAKVTAIKQTIATKMTAIHSFEHFSLGISAVILLVSLLIVFTNVNASVNERTKEIGIFMAVGFNKWNIMKIILLEVLIASLIAGVLGFFIGVAGAQFITPMLSMNENMEVYFSYILLLKSAGLAVMAGILASIIPAVKAADLDPTVAFRSL